MSGRSQGSGEQYDGGLGADLIGGVADAGTNFLPFLALLVVAGLVLIVLVPLLPSILGLSIEFVVGCVVVIALAIARMVSLRSWIIEVENTDPSGLVHPEDRLPEPASGTLPELARWQFQRSTDAARAIHQLVLAIEQGYLPARLEGGTRLTT